MQGEEATASHRVAPPDSHAPRNRRVGKLVLEGQQWQVGLSLPRHCVPLPLSQKVAVNGHCHPTARSCSGRRALIEDFGAGAMVTELDYGVGNVTDALRVRRRRHS